MRFSVWPSSAQPWEGIQAVARLAERTGWDRVYVADHFMPNAPDASSRDGDTIECWSVVAALAATVPRVRLATLVSSVTYRHPAILANIAAAVDIISGGRLVLGVGAGWQQNEHAAYGVPLGSVAERLDRFEEACQVLTSMLRDRRTTFEGRHYRVVDAPNQPSPVQERLPLLVGGGGEKRTMRIAARWADEWNAWTTPDVLARKVEVLRRHCDALGRDPADIAVSTQALLFLSTDETWLAAKRGFRDRPAIAGTPAEVVDIVAAYRAAGADELIVPDFTLGTGTRREETLALFREEVAAHFS